MVVPRQALHFRVQCDNVDEIKGIFKDLLYDPSVKREELRNRSLLNTGGLPVTIRSPVNDWALTALPEFTLPSEQWTVHLEYPLKDDIPVIVDALKLNDVVILESPTGAGKSIAAPEFCIKAAERRALDPGLDQDSPFKNQFKALHIVRTGAQAAQNSKYIRQSYLDACQVQIDSFSATLSRTGLPRSNSLEPGKTNYLYTTEFFVEHALHHNCYFNVVVIDDINDLTSSIIKTFRIVREMLISGHVLRVVLLTATLSDDLKKMCERYFIDGGASVHHLKLGRSPFTTTVFGAGENEVSRDSLGCRRRGRDDDRLASSETRGNGEPKIGTIKDRVVSFCTTVAQRYLKGVGRCPGSIAFLPGAAEVISTRLSFLDFVKRIPPDCSNIQVISVTGQDREDLDIISKSAKGKARFVFSTPLLSYGVTPVDVNIIIDSGIMKLPGFQNRQGVGQLVEMWQDKAMQKQRQGRVGRTSDGTVYQAYSLQQAAKMQTTDHTLLRLKRSYTTADCSHVLKYGSSLMVTPSPTVMNTLLVETAAMGFLCVDATDTPHVDTVARAFGKAFPDIPLDLCNLLIRCHSSGVLFSAVAYVASHLAHHPALKKPSGRAGQPGRDSRLLGINLWPSLMQCDSTTDIALYTEILVNLLIDGPGRNFIPASIRLNLPEIRSFACADGIAEVWRYVSRVFSGLNSLGLVEDMQELLAPANSNLCFIKNNGYDILQLRSNHSVAFNHAITAALGHRVLDQAPWELQTEIYRTLYVIGGDLPGRIPRLAQGEQAVKADPGTLVCYSSLFQRASHENFVTGLLHQMTGLDMLLYGNTYAGENDEVRDYNDLLILHTNSYPLLFYFDDPELLNLVARFRKVQHLITGSWIKFGSKSGLVTSFNNTMRRLNEKRNHFQVQPTNGTYGPRPRVSHMDFFPREQP